MVVGDAPFGICATMTGTGAGLGGAMTSAGARGWTEQPATSTMPAVVAKNLNDRVMTNPLG